MKLKWFRLIRVLVFFLMSGVAVSSEAAPSCFPEQVWDDYEGVCKGVPRCPTGYETRPDLALWETCVRVPEFDYWRDIDDLSYEELRRLGPGYVNCRENDLTSIYRVPVNDSREVFLNEIYRVRLSVGVIYDLPQRKVSVSNRLLNQKRAEAGDCEPADGILGWAWCCP